MYNPVCALTILIYINALNVSGLNSIRHTHMQLQLAELHLYIHMDAYTRTSSFDISSHFKNTIAIVIKGRATEMYVHT